MSAREPSAAIRPETRHIVVPRSSVNRPAGLYGVRDRQTGELIRDRLSREEARWVVWDLNGRHGGEPKVKS